MVCVGRPNAVHVLGYLHYSTWTKFSYIRSKAHLALVLVQLSRRDKFLLSLASELLMENYEGPFMYNTLEFSSNRNLILG